MDQLFGKQPQASAFLLIAFLIAAIALAAYQGRWSPHVEGFYLQSAPWIHPDDLRERQKQREKERERHKERLEDVEKYRQKYLRELDKLPGVNPYIAPMPPMGYSTNPYIAPVAPVGYPTNPYIAPVAPVGYPTNPYIAPVAPVGYPTNPYIAPVPPVGYSTGSYVSPSVCQDYAHNICANTTNPNSCSTTHYSDCINGSLPQCEVFGAQQCFGNTTTYDSCFNKYKSECLTGGMSPRDSPF